MGYVEVISGVERRRRWSEGEKRTIVEAAFAPGAVVREVARRADVCPSLIYKWRRDAGASEGFARVLVVPDGDTAGASMAAVEVEFSDRRARIPPSTPPELASAVVKALAGR
jgi:transposase